MIDASAGAEFVAKTPRGERLAALVPRGARRDVPDHFLVETAAVLRRWELKGQLSRQQAAEAFSRLVNWPGRRYELLPLLPEAWAYRQNIVMADALYVSLALRLGADLLTDDYRLTGSPTLPPQLTLLALPPGT